MKGESFFIWRVYRVYLRRVNGSLQDDYFVYWNVKVPWTFSTTKALLRPGSKVTMHSWPLAWAFNQRFLPFETFLWPEKLRSGHETFRNVEKRWTLRNGQEWWTVRDVGRSGTFAKSRSRYVHVHVQKRKNYCNMNVVLPYF